MPDNLIDTYEDARRVALASLAAYWTGPDELAASSSGLVDGEFYVVPTGPAAWIVDGDASALVADDMVTLVRRADGEVLREHHAAVAQRIGRMRMVSV